MSDPMDERSCIWVSSRGLLKSCDRHNRVPRSSHRHIDPDILDNIKDYDVVHICSWLTISIFCRHFVPKLNKKIIVVTNDSDMDAPIFDKPEFPVGPGDYIAKDEILAFLNSDRCVHWFTQNCTLDHPKVTPIPIGMDYHTFLAMESSIKQEKRLNITHSISKPFHERKLKCYGNFHFTVMNKYYTYDRIECIKGIPSHLIDYEPKPVPRPDTWKKQIGYAFVPSPAGMGIDCHRTWEAILLGCIAIVRRFNVPHEKLYDDLPILIVDKWTDVTEELLQKTVDEFRQRSFNFEKLKLKYWTDLIQSYKK